MRVMTIMVLLASLEKDDMNICLIMISLFSNEERSKFVFLMKNTIMFNLITLKYVYTHDENKGFARTY